MDWVDLVALLSGFMLLTLLVEFSTEQALRLRRFLVRWRDRGQAWLDRKINPPKVRYRWGGIVPRSSLHDPGISFDLNWDRCIPKVLEMLYGLPISETGRHASSVVLERDAMHFEFLPPKVAPYDWEAEDEF